MAKPITTNTLFYGNNLPILREYIPDESIDLIYLDPPFNSKRTYNVLFKYESGEESEAQIAAFDDTWHWDHNTAALYRELVTDSPTEVSKMIEALHDFIGTNQMMAYLVMMTARLVELHRVLKPTGSLYLHCDPTASHYLKIVLDTIFGAKNFQNEIVWGYEIGSRSKKRWARKHDIILFYSKTSKFNFYWERVADPRKEGTHMKTRVDEDGREYQEKKDKKSGKVYRYYVDKGAIPKDWWAGPQQLNRDDAERLGYPTQKPLELLERIIAASSNPGDVVFDPFCGCGTAVAAAQKLGRKWIGIDVTHLAIALQKYRLQEMFPDAGFKIIGEPESVRSAQQLALDDRNQFEWWAVSLVNAMPTGGTAGSKKGKKGADKGIDGVLTIMDESAGKSNRVLVQVKSGKVGSRDIRDLVGTVEREKAAIGIFITLEPPTKPMITEAASAGFYRSPGWHKDYPRIQILTIEELLDGATIQMPYADQTFKKAQREKEPSPQQKSLFD